MTDPKPDDISRGAPLAADSGYPAVCSDLADSPAPRLGRWRRRLFVLVALCLSMVTTLGAGEIYVRIFRPQVLFPRYVTDSPFGIRVNVPNATYWHTSPEMKVQFRINSMGIRGDREYALEKPARTVRIVGLGDSFTQGYEVELRDTYLYRLEGLLRARGHRVEVVNLGVSGYGTAEELILLEEVALGMQPDIVIVGFFQNDLDDNVRSCLYRLDDAGFLVRDAATYLPAIGIRNRLYSFWAYRWLAENSQLFALAREGLATQMKRKMVQANMPTTADKKDADRYKQRLAGRLLDQMKHECDRRDIGFVLLDIPSRTLGRSGLPTGSMERISPDQIVRPGGALAREGPDAYLYRRRGHAHWTPRGHEIAALALAQIVELMLGDVAGDHPGLERADAGSHHGPGALETE